jgi:hypothetical protein
MTRVTFEADEAVITLANCNVTREELCALSELLMETSVETPLFAPTNSQSVSDNIATFRICKACR